MVCDGSEDSLWLLLFFSLCICWCCCVVGPDGSPGPGGKALVNNSVEAHYQGSADSASDSTLIAGRQAGRASHQLSEPRPLLVCSCSSPSQPPKTKEPLKFSSTAAAGSVWSRFPPTGRVGEELVDTPGTQSRVLIGSFYYEPLTFLIRSSRGASSPAGVLGTADMDGSSSAGGRLCD